jgi:hypothetical protein
MRTWSFEEPSYTLRRFAPAPQRTAVGLGFFIDCPGPFPGVRIGVRKTTLSPGRQVRPEIPQSDHGLETRAWEITTTAQERQRGRQAAGLRCSAGLKEPLRTECWGAERRGRNAITFFRGPSSSCPKPRRAFSAPRVGEAMGEAQSAKRVA